MLKCNRMSQQSHDNRATDLTKGGMVSAKKHSNSLLWSHWPALLLSPLDSSSQLKGIEQAAAFILFLSGDVLQRPYCCMEIRQALALGKPMVLLHGECQ